jgi:protocatechuate 4,5-dioxygenase beta chain
MAKLVEVIGVTHNPLLLRRMADPKAGEAMRQGRDDYRDMRRRMAAAKPDVLVVIASDHVNQWFMDNMPAFLVGKAPRSTGPFPHEVRHYGLEEYTVDTDVSFAKGLIVEGSRAGVDFAYSDDFRMDHAFTVPLWHVRPEMDLPVVPVWTNVVAPPLPSSQRFFQVGQAMRAAIEALPGDMRVGVLSSGHMAVELGGPRMFDGGSTDQAFDQRMMDLIEAGDSETVVREATIERMLAAGNMTPGFLNYVLLMGIAGGRVPSAAGVRFQEPTTSNTGAIPHMAWDLDAGGAA